MPRFYFNVDDDRTTLDQEGTELPDIETARREAVTVAAEVLRDGSGKVVWGESPGACGLLTSPTVEAIRCSRCGFLLPRADEYLIAGPGAEVLVDLPRGFAHRGA